MRRIIAAAFVVTLFGLPAAAAMVTRAGPLLHPLPLVRRAASRR
jgi:hypothetical protein